MNVKKFLKKESNEDLRSLETESDRALLAQLKGAVAASAKPKRRKRWLWAIPSSVAACAVAAVLIVHFALFPGIDPGKIKYDAMNFVRIDANITELSERLPNLTVNTSIDQLVGVQKTYDSVSGDDLFYTLSVDEESEYALYKLAARIIVNKNYEFDEFEITDEYVTNSYSNYSVKYWQRITVDPDTGLNLVQCNGKIESEHYEIYIMNYEEYSLENGTFLTVIDNLFTFGS